MVHVDPDGEFFTWIFGKDGISLGFNFGFFGFGINIGWSDGGSFGVYGEVGPRVGGTGFGSGATVSQSVDFGFKRGEWSTTTSVGAYASMGPVNMGASGSHTYNRDSPWGWGVGVGIGTGNDSWGEGLNVGYGSDKWSFGAGGYYNSNAWDSNPTYNPDAWNNDQDILENNNCYSYALDDPKNSIGGKPQPGQYSGEQFTELSIDNITNAVIRDGRAKKPNFWNKLGFGKDGYYSVYLVIDNMDMIDYHWYRQDKGGKWSHKPGNTQVINVDASGKFIRNPARANHFYHSFSNGRINYSFNYNNGRKLLWIKR